MGRIGGGVLETAFFAALYMNPISNLTVFQMLYDSFAPAVYDHILRAVGDPGRADDILKKTFAYAIRCIDRHFSSVRLHAWFLEIAHFIILEEAVIVTIGAGFPEDCHFDRYADSWSALKEEEQKILTLALLKGCSPEEIAISMNIDPEQLMSKVTAAVTRFHQLINREPENL
jgi:DNA-directed RNA polymerase specialized sigma24 family protein